MTNRSSSLVAAAALLLGLAGSAVAQPGPTPGPARATKPAKPAKAATPRVKTLTIEEELVEGGVPSGQIIPVDARGFSDHTSLIRLRHSFVDMILKDAENL